MAQWVNAHRTKHDDMEPTVLWKGPTPKNLSSDFHIWVPEKGWVLWLFKWKKKNAGLLLAPGLDSVETGETKSAERKQQVGEIHELMHRWGPTSFKRAHNKRRGDGWWETVLAPGRSWDTDEVGHQRRGEWYMDLLLSLTSQTELITNAYYHHLWFLSQV